MSHLLPHSASRDRQLPTAIAIISATSTKPTGPPTLCVVCSPPLPSPLLLPLP
jgi:hypothetical protein